MKNIILLALMLFSAFGFAQLSQSDKLYATAKLWGYLKYYHPQVASGKLDWDQQLFDIIKDIDPATTTADLSVLFERWLDGLGPVNICKSCKKVSSKKQLETNFDLSWTQDSHLFSTSVSQKLKFLEHNRNIGKSHYFGTQDRIGNVEFKNEKVYADVWNDRNLRLLSLIRFWNQVEYFSPNKYLTDQNWDAVLREMIPVFENADSEQKLDLAMLELVTKTNDSHATINTPRLTDYFGRYWIAGDFKIIDNKAVITAFHDVEKAKKDDLRIGDVIENVDGQTISEIMTVRNRYLPASNPAVKKRRRYAFVNGPENKVSLLISRNGKTFEKTVSRYLSDELNDPKDASPKWKIMDGNIGLVDMGRLEKQDIEEMWATLKTAKAIILDVRNYPRSTLYPLAEKMISRSDFVRFTQPDPDYPGKFFWSEKLKVGGNSKNVFLGKIILLVNEMTQSHAEFTAMGFQSAPNCITIGSQTAGADGNISEVLFPTGTKSYITGLGVYYPDGTQTQRKGIQIDVEVHPTINGIQSGRDEILEKALRIASEP